MMKFFLSTCVSLFFVSFAYSQRLSGTLIDKKTNETIPFATVQIGEDYGVVTNQEGDFSINIKNFQPTDSLVFSSMGFERKAIAIKDFKEGKLYLTQSTIQLREVMLSNKEMTAQEIMQKVNENLEKNYGAFSRFTVFRRNKNAITPEEIGFKIKKADFINKKTLKKFNRMVDSASTAMAGNTSTAFNAFLAEAVIRDSVKVQLKKATKLINEEKHVDVWDISGKIFEAIAKNLQSNNTYKVKTGIIKIGDSIDISKGINFKKDTTGIDSLYTKNFRGSVKNILRQSDFTHKEKGGITISIGGAAGGNIVNDIITQTDDYEYKVEDVSTFNGELIYVISYTPDSGLFGKQGSYTGKIYVSADTFAVLKTDFQLAEGEHGAKFNWKFLLGIKFVENEKSGTVIYQKNKNGKYAPKYIQVAGQRYAYFSRPFSLKENDENRKDRIKLKIDFTLEFNNTYKDEWLFFDTEDLSEAEFASFKENTGIVVEHLSKYNPEIWKEYNILTPTEAVLEFKY